MSLGGCIRTGLGLWVLEIILTLAFAPPAYLRALIGSEIVASRAAWGESHTQRVLRAAHEHFNSALHALPFRAVPGDEYPAEPTQRGITIVIERLRSLLFLALYRLSAIGEAALPLMLGILAAAIDGLAVRRRRAYSFATTSTAAYNAATYILLSLSMSAFLYLVAPLALPAALLPLAAFGAAGAVWIVFAHLPGAGPLIGLRT